MAIVPKYEFQINLRYGINVNVQSCFDDSESIVRTDLLENFSGTSYGHVWSIARAIVQSGIDWIDWEFCHERIVDQYHELLSSQSEYRHCSYKSEAERKKIMWDRYALACQLYDLDYVPEGVNMPNFVEGKTGSLSDFRLHGAEIGLTGCTLDDYFLRSFDSERIFEIKNSSFDSASEAELIEKGLIRTGDAMNKIVMASFLTFEEAKSILNSIGVKPDKSLGKCRNQVIDILESKSSKAALRLLASRDWSKYGEIIPLPGYEWSDFQSFRQQIKGAATALVDIFDKKVSPDLTKILY